MDAIKIVKHISPSSINERGDILFPFEQWDITKSGGGWYSNIHSINKTSISEIPFIPLNRINENPWMALNEFNINTAEFKDKVKYTCPYTGYVYFWCVPLFILTKDISFWFSRTSLPEWEIRKYTNIDWIRKFNPIMGENGFKFTKIQRALLGTGYTQNTMIGDGEPFLYDTTLSLSNEDFLCAKVWIWFHKK